MSMKTWALQSLKHAGKYLAATIVPLFLGSFILAGALAKYGSNDSLNKTILESAYKPSKERYRECHRSHNRLAIAEQELAGTYGATAEELRFALKGDISKLPEEHGFLMQGLLKKQQELEAEVSKLQGSLPGCYDTLYSTLEDLGLLLGIHEDVKALMTARATEFNQLHKRRAASSEDALKGTDPSAFLQRMFRHGLEQEFMANREMAPELMQRLAKHSASMAAQDQKIFDMEQRSYQRINELTASKIEQRMNKGIWSFLFG